MQVPWIDGIEPAPFRCAYGNPSHQWTRTLCRASTITAAEGSTNLRPVNHPDRRSRQEYRFLRRVYGRRAMPEPGGRLRRLGFHRWIERRAHRSHSHMAGREDDRGVTGLGRQTDDRVLDGV